MERVVSPGVFTRERDQSFLGQGVAEIGAAFIGPTAKGPAFIPQIVESQTEFERIFGQPDGNSYVPYAVTNYLEEAARATVVRVLGLGGYEGSSVQSATLYVTGSGGKFLLAALHPSISGSSITEVNVGSIGGASGSTNFDLQITGSDTPYGTEGASAFSGSAAFIKSLLGTNPDNRKNAYAYATFPGAYDLAADTASILVETSSTALDFGGVDYSPARTPWIQSQTLGGSKIDLFRFWTLNEGSNANRDVKVSIASIKPGRTDGAFATFTVLVRKWNDTDQKVDVLESFENVNLDPSSTDFILRRIGTAEPYTDPVTSETYMAGDWPNKSDYVRVEPSSDLYSAGEDAVPYGFKALVKTVNVTGTTLPRPSLITTRWASGSYKAMYTTGSTADNRIYYGWNGDVNVDGNLAYLNPIPASTTETVNYSTSSGSVVTEFSLENLGPNEYDGASDISLSTNSHITLRKFTVPFQGGFDGFAPNVFRSIGKAITATNCQGFDLSVSTASGSVAYKKAVDAVSNPESYDINLLVIPGANNEQHPYIVNYALGKCEDRQDCFYILDLTSWGATVDTAIEQAAAFDSNYAAGYYPWVKVLDTNTAKYIWAPPSVVLPEVYAYNDNVAAEWFAPAGLNRGGIPGALKVKSRLQLATRDELYENKVNPIATFPGLGIVAWGQKTLQERASALDRINVRRLLIALKKYIASASKYLVFEQNTEATRNRFLNIVNPYLASVQERQGLYAFRVIMDESNNTPDIIDRNILKGDIYLQPTKTAEFIILDFNILPTGATFPNG